MSYHEMKMQIDHSKIKAILAELGEDQMMKYNVTNIHKFCAAIKRQARRKYPGLQVSPFDVFLKSMMLAAIEAENYGGAETGLEATGVA